MVGNQKRGSFSVGEKYMLLALKSYHERLTQPEKKWDNGNNSL